MVSSVLIQCVSILCSSFSAEFLSICVSTWCMISICMSLVVCWLFLKWYVDSVWCWSAFIFCILVCRLVTVWPISVCGIFCRWPNIQLWWFYMCSCSLLCVRSQRWCCAELFPCCDVWAGGAVGDKAFACVFAVGFCCGWFGHLFVDVWFC